MGGDTGASASASGRPARVPTDRGAQLEAWSKGDTPDLREYLDMMSGEKPPILTLEGFVLRHPSYVSSEKPSNEKSSNGKDELDWLNTAASDSVTRCTVDVQVWRGPDRSKRTYLSIGQRREGMVRLRRGDGDSQCYHVQLSRPCHIELSMQDIFQEERAHSRQNSVVFEVCLTFPKTKDASVFLKTLGVAMNSGRGFSALDDIRLRTSWKQLPQCPADRQLLRLYQGNTEKDVLEYGIEISMGWDILDNGTPLDQIGRLIRNSQLARRQQLPTPTTSEEQDKPDRAHQITYIYEQSGRLLIDDLKCPFCQSQYEFTPFDRLHVHLLTYHNYFNFHIEEATKTSTSTLHRVVHFRLAKKPVEKPNTHGKDDEKLNWVAPDRPFDQDAFLRGDSAWVEQPVPAAPTRECVRMQITGENANVASHTQSRDGSATAEQVRDKPQRALATHAVPHARDATGHDVKFYRTGSKRLFRTGELITDSDDEIDDSWLEQRQRTNLKSVRVKDGARERALSSAECDFIEDFNRHVDDEERSGASGDRLGRDGIIRFSRKHADKMHKPGWYKQFNSMLRRRLRDRIIDDVDLDYCLSFAPAEQEPYKSDDDENDETTAQATAGAKVSLSNRRRHIVTESPRSPQSQSPAVSAQSARRARTLYKATESPSQASEGLFVSPASPEAGQRHRSSSMQSTSSVGGGVRRRWPGSKPGFLYMDDKGTIMPPPSPARTSIAPEARYNGSTAGLRVNNGIQTTRNRRKGACFCGDIVESMRGSIICDNTACTGRQFHMSCVGLDRRPDGWRCDECVTGAGKG